MNAPKEQKETLITVNRHRPGAIHDALRRTLTNFVAALFLCALTVWAAQPVPPPVHLESIEMIPRLKITGTVGGLFRIEFRDDLGQTSNWVTLQNLVLPSSPFLFIDTNVSSKVRRFYRVTSEPRPPQLVWIAPGTFTLGSPIIEDDRFIDEGPQTTVTISKGFWMGKYEITQAEYMALMGIDPSAFPDELSRPVDNVNWNDATTYCARLTEQERQEGRLPTGYAYRLPTEAEWEYVARAGTSTRFSYGDDPGYTVLPSYAWFGSNSDELTHPVGTKSPNLWGVYDLHGNVWEWCSDWYASSYPGGNLVDPRGPVSGVSRVIRGGSWKGLNRFCRSASRSSGSPLIPGSNVGFRVVLALVRPQ
jgi:formylglycine-generating enzyme required for sulfatase activity